MKSVEPRKRVLALLDFGGWRRGWDSNPRGPFGAYSLSRGAPSTTRPPLRDAVRIKIVTHNQLAYVCAHASSAARRRPWRRHGRVRRAPAESGRAVVAMDYATPRNSQAATRQFLMETLRWGLKSWLLCNNDWGSLPEAVPRGALSVEPATPIGNVGSKKERITPRLFHQRGWGRERCPSAKYPDPFETFDWRSENEHQEPSSRLRCGSRRSIRRAGR